MRNHRGQELHNGRRRTSRLLNLFGLRQVESNLRFQNPIVLSQFIDVFFGKQFSNLKARSENWTGVHLKDSQPLLGSQPQSRHVFFNGIVEFGFCEFTNEQCLINRIPRLLERAIQSNSK